MDIEIILRDVLEKARPGEDERAFVVNLMRELEITAREAAEELDLDVRPYFVGSLAKDTYLAGDYDVDLFLAFPLETPLEELRREGLTLGKSIAERLQGYEVAYAEHPYVRAKYMGVDVDLVPCYDVKDWRDVRTAVDRSILHTRWVKENIKGMNDEVRLLKRFLKGIRVYGSEVYVRGFSGYLAEIMIVHYGSFLSVIKSVNSLLRRRKIDPGDWLRKESDIAVGTVKREMRENRPLIVIDPVDPRRNVAANLSWERYGRFYFKSGEFLEKPSLRFFFPGRKVSGSYIKELRKRKTGLVTILFEAPELVDDLLIPQLERSARGLERALKREGFNVLGWNVGKSKWAFIMLEVDRVERERVKLKPGPEFFAERAVDFYRKNEKVWLFGKRLYSEKWVRESVVDVIEELFKKGQVALGRGIKKAVRNSDVLLNYVPRDLEGEAYLFLSREKWGLKD